MVLDARGATRSSARESTAHGRTAAIASRDVLGPEPACEHHPAGVATAHARGASGSPSCHGRSIDRADLAPSQQQLSRRASGARPRGRRTGRGRRRSSSTSPTKTATRSTVSGASSTARRAAGSRVGEDEADQVGAGLDRGVDVLLPGQAAHLDERPRQQLGELRAWIVGAHQRRPDQDGVRARELGCGGLAREPRSRSRRSAPGRVGACATQLELGAPVDAERRQVARVDPDHRGAELPSRARARPRRAPRRACRARATRRARSSAAAAASSRSRRIRSTASAPASASRHRARRGREEALGEQRQARRGARAARRSSDEPAEPLVDEHRHRACTRAARTRVRRRATSAVRAQVAGRRRAPFELGDRAEAWCARVQTGTSRCRCLAARRRRARRAVRGARLSRSPRARPRCPRAGRPPGRLRRSRRRR